MQPFVIGQYLPGKSLLHRLDPRAKLLFVFGFMILIFLSNNLISYCFLLVFTMISVFFSRISLVYFIKALKPVLFLILLTAFLHLFFTKGTEQTALWATPLFTIYQEGVIQAAFISLRFILLIFIASLLTFTTSPVDITDGLESLLAPLKTVKVPTHEIALMMSIALRFIPTLWEETEKIRKAQLARGAKLESGSIWTRLKSYLPILIPLFLSAFRRAEELAFAMESRCYRGGEGRTKYRLLQYGVADFVLLLLFFVLLGILLLVRT